MDRRLVMVAVGLGCLAAGFAAGLLVSGSDDGDAAPTATAARDDQATAAPGEANVYTVFLRDGPIDVNDLRRRFEELSIVSAVEYVSKDEAIATLQEKVDSDLSDSLEELDTNPLPRSFTIVLAEPLDESVVGLLLTEAAGPHRDRIEQIASA